jgi:ABC-type nitrate/sulfonate/bicarbonate transport system substrate-binding protein
VVLAVAIVVPGFVLLYVLHQKGLLPEEGTDDVTVVGPAGLRTQTHTESSQ